MNVGKAITKAMQEQRAADMRALRWYGVVLHPLLREYIEQAGRQ